MQKTSSVLLIVVGLNPSCTAWYLKPHTKPFHFKMAATVGILSSGHLANQRPLSIVAFITRLPHFQLNEATEDGGRV